MCASQIFHSFIYSKIIRTLYLYQFITHQIRFDAGPMHWISVRWRGAMQARDLGGDEDAPRGG